MHLKIEEDLEKWSWIKKEGTNHREEFMAAGKSCLTIFWPTSCLQDSACDSYGFSTKCASKGTRPKWKQKLAWKCTKPANISICRLHDDCPTIPLLILTCGRKKYFLGLCFWAPQGAAMLLHSLPMKSRKRLAHDIMATCSTCQPHYDVKNRL